jgi:hypothetical protein
VKSAVIKSFRPDYDSVVVTLDGRPGETAFRVRGSDRSTVAKMLPGDRIQFDSVCDRGDRVLAIDVAPVRRSCALKYPSTMPPVPQFKPIAQVRVVELLSRNSLPPRLYDA